MDKLDLHKIIVTSLLYIFHYDHTFIKLKQIYKQNRYTNAIKCTFKGKARRMNEKKYRMCKFRVKERCTNEKYHRASLVLKRRLKPQKSTQCSNCTLSDVCCRTLNQSGE